MTDQQKIDDLVTELEYIIAGWEVTAQMRKLTPWEAERLAMAKATVKRATTIE
jgi:hypothetical protein